MDEELIEEILSGENPRRVRELFKQHGAEEINELCYQGRHTALHFACDNGYMEIVDILIENGADVNADNAYGNTPLHSAAQNGEATIAARLLEKGASVNARGFGGRTPLHFARDEREGVEGGVDLVGVLLANGADPTIKDNEGQTPIHYGSDVQTLRMILKDVPDVNIQDDFGNTPLHFSEHEGISAELLRAGANPNMRCGNGETALHRADEPISRILVKYGADIHARDDDGNTAIHYCNAEDGAAKVKFLLAVGVNANAQNNYAKTPYDTNGELVRNVLQGHQAKQTKQALLEGLDKPFKATEQQQEERQTRQRKM